MRLTLGDIKNSRIPRVVGIAACSEEFTQLVNDAQEELANAGIWWGTFGRYRMCATNNCLVWPREVKTIIGMKICGYSMPIQNQWYEFMESVYSPETAVTNGNMCDSSQMLLDRGTTTQFRQFTVPSTIRLYPASATDIGKRVLIQGLDSNGVPVRTEDSGTYVYGEYLTLASPYVESAFTYAAGALTGVQKERTNFRVLAYAASAADPTDETQIAIWGPDETRPDYRRSYLTWLQNPCSQTEEAPACGPCGNNGDGCDLPIENCTNVVLEAIVRREFIPAYEDTDWLFISNKNAILCAMKALDKRDKNEFQEAEEEMQNALRSLRNELEAFQPSDQTVVNVLPYGTVGGANRKFAGFI